MEAIMRKVMMFWLASLAVVAVLASGLTLAQTKQGERRILSGDDIGFRVESTNRSGEPVGTLMVRIDGAWMPVASAPTFRPAK
jgi:hypothetical protein